MKVAQNNLLLKPRRQEKISGIYKETSNLLPEFSVIWKVIIIFSSFDIFWCLNIVFQTQENNWNFKASASGSPCTSCSCKVGKIHWVKSWECCMKAIDVCWIKPDQTPSWGKGIQFPLKLTWCVATKSEMELAPTCLVWKLTPYSQSPHTK